MKTWLAIIFSLGLLAVSYAISFLIQRDLTWFLIVSTSLWAAIDSTNIQLRRYKSGISYGPVVLFIACVLLWIVGFPWYLSMRYKIKNGTAILKEGAIDVAA